MSDAIKGALGESAYRLAADLRAGDPTRPIGGELIINDSPSVSRLLKWREELPSTNHLARQLHVLRSQEAAPPAPPPPQLPPRNPSGGRDLTQSGEREAPPGRTPRDTGKKLEGEDDRPIDALSHLITFSDDGKTCVLGRPETGDKVNLVEFRKKYPKACESTMSKHKFPYLLCPHAGKEGHTTKTSGAHKIPKDMKTAFPLFLILGAATSTKGAVVGETRVSNTAALATDATSFNGLATHTYSPPIGGYDADWLAPTRATTAKVTNSTRFDRAAAAHSAAPCGVLDRLAGVCSWLLDVATSATPLDGGTVVDAPAHCIYNEVSAAMCDEGCQDHLHCLPYDIGGSQHDAPFSVQLCPGEYNRRGSLAWLLQPFGIHSHQFDIKQEGIHADIRRRTVAHRCRTLLDSP